MDGTKALKGNMSVNFCLCERPRAALDKLGIQLALRNLRISAKKSEP